MQTTGFFLSLMLGWLASACAAEQLGENFDDLPLGSIAAQPGWTRATWLATQTGQVSAAGSFSDSHCLELPWRTNGSSAVFTNFLAANDPSNQHAVIRCSAKLFTPNSNMFFQIGLRDSASGSFLKFTSGGGLGLFGFQYHDSVFVPLVTNRFADLTFFYNRSNHYYRLDYDGTNRLAWATNGEGIGVVTQFNQFVVTRLTNTASTTGLFLVDNVRVETFPPHVWAWWRCTSQYDATFVEQLGAFPPTLRAGNGDTDRAGASALVWDGTADFHNEGATRQLIAGPVNGAIATPSSTNWTVEAVFRLPPDASNTAFLDWGKGSGFNTNGPYLTFSYSSSSGGFFIYARDAEQTDNNYHYLTLGPFVPNGRWQHAAIVKTVNTVVLYVDYQFVDSQTLNTYADGAYTFNTQSRAVIGQTLNGGNSCGPDSLIDEVRFSGKALAVSEFLQPGQPLIVDIRGNAMNNDPWPLTMKGILGKSYHLETSPALGPAANWQPVPGTAFTSSTTFTIFDLPDTTPKTNFVRLRRD